MSFSISFALEHFQQRMNKILNNLPSVMHVFNGCHYHLWQKPVGTISCTLRCLQTASVTLNWEKYQSGKSTLSILDLIINANCALPDPNKISAAVNMKASTTSTELWHFLAIVNQLSEPLWTADPATPQHFRSYRQPYNTHSPMVQLMNWHQTFCWRFCL